MVYDPSKIIVTNPITVFKNGTQINGTVKGIYQGQDGKIRVQIEHLVPQTDEYSLDDLSETNEEATNQVDIQA